MQIYATGYDWRHTDNCALDLPPAALTKTRNVALTTWSATLVSLGGVIWISLYLLGSSGGIIWWAFGLWKAISLCLALVVTPGCFEGYSYLADRGHPFEASLGLLTLLSWLALLAAIIFRAATTRGASTPSM